MEHVPLTARLLAMLNRGHSTAKVLAVASLSLGAFACDAPTSPGVAQASPAARNASCATCHASIASEWNSSQHRSAFTDAPFTVAHALEPLAFCRGCHAPEQDESITSTTADARIGVACTSCHGDAPHAPDASPDDACARCHQFEFPHTGKRDSVALMQSTIVEHANSKFSDVPCADCHMPSAADGHRSHRFEASRDPSMLRRAVSISARLIDAQTVEVSLRAKHAGHAVPTGDLLRRLEVGASPRATPDAAQRRYLARHFAPVRQRSGVVARTEVRDDRVPADGSTRRVRLEVDNPGSAPIRWWVEYQRVAHHRAFSRQSAVLDGRVCLAEGLLVATETKP